MYIAHNPEYGICNIIYYEYAEINNDLFGKG